MAGLFRGGGRLWQVCVGEGKPLVVMSVGGITLIQKISHQLEKSHITFELSIPSFVTLHSKVYQDNVQ